MGRRRSRKAERRLARRQEPGLDHLAEPSFEDLLAIEEEQHQRDEWELPWGHPLRPNARVALKTCGGCTEFVEDGEGGRGTCLHPGSGILAPWTDTPACNFYSARRR